MNKQKIEKYYKKEVKFWVEEKTPTDYKVQELGINSLLGVRLEYIPLMLSEHNINTPERIEHFKNYKAKANKEVVRGVFYNVVYKCLDLDNNKSETTDYILDAIEEVYGELKPMEKYLQDDYVREVGIMVRLVNRAFKDFKNK